MPPQKRQWSGKSRPHRLLKLPSHYASPQRGRDVQELQKSINNRAKDRGLHTIKVDGEAGRATIARGRQVAWALGINIKAPGLTPYTQRLIRWPGLRNPVQLRRAKARQKKVEQIAEAQNDKVKVVGNKVTGGTKMQRVIAGAMAAASLYYSGKRKSFYSQAGENQFDLGITGEKRGMRSDCSQFVVSMHKSAGAPDPCEGDYSPSKLHYTGTLMKGGRYVSRQQLRPGGVVLYGNYPHFHTEIWVGNGDGKTTYAELARQGHPHRDRTVGHGSPPVDFGDIDMAANQHFVNYD